MTFRKSVFWVHLAAGLIAGLVVAIMSFTGTAIAFQHDIVDYLERDQMHVTPPAPNAPRLSLKELIDRARDAEPDSRPTGVTVSSDPTQVVQVAFGRDGTYYVNPYTGEVHEPGASKSRAFFLTMENWHRFLGRSGEQRTIGKAVNDVCNAAFLFLALSGLFLWWPRKRRTKGLKRSLVFLRDATGRARDWNWHNVIGFWSAPILIILTGTGVVMSYRWANDLVYKVTGSPVPVQQGPGNPSPPATLVLTAVVPTNAPSGSSTKENPPAAGSVKEGLPAVGPANAGTATQSAAPAPTTKPAGRPLGYDALIAAAQKLSPGWETLTLRLGGNNRGGGQRPAGDANPSATRPREGQSQARSGPQPVVITVKEPATSPRFGNTTLTLDPLTGELIKRETFADGSLGRRVRAWIRFLHTGEAFGWVSELVAAVASLGACFLVYTGFAMSWRRFFMKKEEKPAATP